MRPQQRVHGVINGTAAPPTGDRCGLALAPDLTRPKDRPRDEMLDPDWTLLWPLPLSLSFTPSPSCSPPDTPPRALVDMLVDILVGRRVEAPGLPPSPPRLVEVPRSPLPGVPLPLPLSWARAMVSTCRTVAPELTWELGTEVPPPAAPAPPRPAADPLPAPAPAPAPAPLPLPPPAPDPALGVAHPVVGTGFGVVVGRPPGRVTCPTLVVLLPPDPGSVREEGARWGVSPVGRLDGATAVSTVRRQVAPPVPTRPPEARDAPPNAAGMEGDRWAGEMPPWAHIAFSMDWRGGAQKKGRGGTEGTGQGGNHKVGFTTRSNNHSHPPPESTHPRGERMNRRGGSGTTIAAGV